MQWNVLCRCSFCCIHPLDDEHRPVLEANAFCSHDCQTRAAISPDLQTTNPISNVCEFHFGSSIKRTLFPGLGDWAFLWAVKWSGFFTVETLEWERIQMKQREAPSTTESRVTPRLWPLNWLAACAHTHTNTQLCPENKKQLNVAYTRLFDWWRRAPCVCVWVFYLSEWWSRRAGGTRLLRMCVFSVPPQVDEIECVIPACERLTLK